MHHSENSYALQTLQAAAKLWRGGLAVRVCRLQRYSWHQQSTIAATAAAERD